MMRFQLTQPWPLPNGFTAPAGTIFDFSKPDMWTALAQGRGLPLQCSALDDEAWEALQRTYPRHLLGQPPKGER
jgi:hypothetical protein